MDLFLAGLGGAVAGFLLGLGGTCLVFWLLRRQVDAGPVAAKPADPKAEAVDARAQEAKAAVSDVVQKQAEAQAAAPTPDAALDDLKKALGGK